MAVHEIFATVVLVTQIQGGQTVGTATGFFYERGDEVFLVTNRHVVRNEATAHHPDVLRLKLHQSASSVGPGVDFDVELYKSGSPLWFVHPAYTQTQIDIAVVRLDQQALKSGHFFKALSASNFLPDNLVLSLGEDVMAIGFPRGLSDTQHNLPILRTAMIASAYGVPFQGQPMFLIDANLHPGMSGSPIITRPKNTWQTSEGNTAIMTGAPMYLLGVHSATLGVKLPSGQEPLGLGTVWYAKLIEETIQAILKR